MKRVGPAGLICSVSLVLVSAVCAQEAASPAQSATPPKLQIDSEEFDFGRVWQGSPAQQEFHIRNVGGRDLSLAVQTTCGCTAVTQPRTPLPPGESTAFIVTYDTQRPGQAAKHIVLTTDDPSRGAVSIPVRGEVKPLFSVKGGENAPGQNAKIIFRDLDPDSAVTSQVELISNNIERPVHIRLKEGCDLGRFELTLKPVEDGRVYELTTVTHPPLLPGWNMATANFETDFAGVPTFELELLAHVPPPVTVRPERLTVLPERKEPFDVLLRVEFRRAQPVAVTQVELNNASVRWSREGLPPTTNSALLDAFQLRIELPAYADLPDRTTLVIHTDSSDPKYARLEVPVSRAKRQATRGELH